MPHNLNFVFLHGAGQGAWVWDETLAALEVQRGADEINAVAIDLPGCGAKRGHDVSALSVEQVADAFIEELAATGLRDIVLVGHSNAGTILPIVAAKRPELIRRLVYVSCIAPPPGQSIMAMIGTGRRGERDDEIGWAIGAEADMNEQLRAMFCNDMAAAEADAFMAKLGFDNWPNPQALGEHSDWRYDALDKLPATFVFCLRDEALPMPWQERFAERFRVQRRVLIDAGHQVMNIRPHALAEVLRHEATQD